MPAHSATSRSRTLPGNFHPSRPDEQPRSHHRTSTGYERLRFITVLGTSDLYAPPRLEITPEVVRVARLSFAVGALLVPALAALLVAFVMVTVPARIAHHCLVHHRV